MMSLQQAPEVIAIINKCQSELRRIIGRPVQVTFKLNAGPVTMQALIEKVCMVCEVSFDDIQSVKRNSRIATARHILCYFSTEYLLLTLHATASIVNRDHTTVINSRNQVINLLSINDPMICSYVMDIRNRLFNELDA